MLISAEDRSFLNRLFGGELVGYEYQSSDLPFIEMGKHVAFRSDSAKDAVECLRRAVLFDGLPGLSPAGWAIFEHEGEYFLAAMVLKTAPQSAVAA